MAEQIGREALEARVLEGLKHKLMAPEIAAEAMRAYADETNRLNRERRINAETDRKALADIERQLKAIIAAIEDGGYTRMLSDRLRALEAQQDEITERLARAPISIPDIHPNIADTYRRKVVRLADALNHPEDRYEAAAALRGLIELSFSPPAAGGASFTPPYMANGGRSSIGLHAPNRCTKRRKLARPPIFLDCQSQCMRGLDPRIHLQTHARQKVGLPGLRPAMTNMGWNQQKLIQIAASIPRDVVAGEHGAHGVDQLTLGHESLGFSLALQMLLAAFFQLRQFGAEDQVFHQDVGGAARMVLFVATLDDDARAVAPVGVFELVANVLRIAEVKLGADVRLAQLLDHALIVGQPVAVEHGDDDRAGRRLVFDLGYQKDRSLVR